MSIANFLKLFIEQITNMINKVTPHSWRTLYLLTVLNVTWIGIETALGKYELPQLLEKFLVLAISVFLVRNFTYYCSMALSSLFQVTGMDTSVLENPARIFTYANAHIVEPITNAVESQFPKMSKLGIFSSIDIQQAAFFLLYGLLMLAVYICFAVIVVQIILAYISYHITMLFGLILLPFSTFKPLDFMGKNVFTAMLSQALTLAVIVFVANLGLVIFEKVLTKSMIDTLALNGKMNVSVLWTIMACVLIYFYLCLKAPTLVMSIMQGSPSLGAGGLFSTIAAGAAAVSMLAGGGGSGGGQQAPAQTGKDLPTPAGGQAPAAAPASNRFVPRSISAPQVNSFGNGGARALPPPAAASGMFLPAPQRQPLMLEDRRNEVPASSNSSDSSFSYQVLS
jgi:type IV secretion system protein TrbL